MNSRHLYLYICAFFFLINIQNLNAQYETKSLNWNTKAYETIIYKGPEGSMPYKLLKPLNYNPSQKYPLVVVLHGRGEGIGACSNPDCVLLWGGKMHLDKRGQFPAFVIFPQTHGGDWRDQNLNKVRGIMQDIAKKYKIDLDRIYIHGLSAGGQGTWVFIGNYPHIFAAASPSSASGNGAYASRLTFTPIWTAQGGKDTNPRPEVSLGMMKALEKYGKHPIYTYDPNSKKQKWPGSSTREPIYTLAPNRGHEAWPELFNCTAWLPWMFNQSKKNIIVIGKTSIKTGESTTIGVSPGFLGYEWSNGQKTNQIKVTQPGTYKVRYKRYAYIFGGPTVWSDWSNPITITKAGLVAENTGDSESVATIENFTLVDADTDKDIKEINDGDIIYTNELPSKHLTIRANIKGNTSKVLFNLDGKLFNDNSYPYMVFGNTVGNNIDVGTHTLTATSKYIVGKMSSEKSLTIGFTFVNNDAAKIAEDISEDSVVTDDVGIVVFPNPVKDRLYFTFDNPQKMVSITIFDKFGNLIYKSEIGANELTSTELNVENLLATPGIYMVRISSDKIREKYFRILRE